jgi:hypothetical protein
MRIYARSMGSRQLGKRAVLESAHTWVLMKMTGSMGGPQLPSDQRGDLTQYSNQLWRGALADRRLAAPVLLRWTPVLMEVLCSALLCAGKQTYCTLRNSSVIWLMNR